jgi:hypothetical protein
MRDLKAAEIRIEEGGIGFMILENRFNEHK